MKVIHQNGMEHMTCQGHPPRGPGVGKYFEYSVSGDQTLPSSF